MKNALALLLCTAALACTPGPEVTVYGGVSGSVSDQAGNDYIFGTAVEGDTIQSSGANCAGTAPQSTLAIFLVTRGGFCSAFEEGAALASNEALLIAIAGTPPLDGGTAPVIAPGNFDLAGPVFDDAGNSFLATVTFATFDDACGQTDFFANSGAVTLNFLDGGEAIGAFVANFADSSGNGAGGTLSGTFDTMTCAATAAEICAGTANKCF